MPVFVVGPPVLLEALGSATPLSPSVRVRRFAESAVATLCPIGDVEPGQGTTPERGLSQALPRQPSRKASQRATSSARHLQFHL